MSKRKRIASIFPETVVICLTLHGAVMLKEIAEDTKVPVQFKMPAGIRLTMVQAVPDGTCNYLNIKNLIVINRIYKVNSIF